MATKVASYHSREKLLREDLRTKGTEDSYDIAPPSKKQKLHSGDHTLHLRRKHVSEVIYCLDKCERIVCSERQYMYSDSGTKYLDMRNNIHHVGHCHPKVNAAGIHQMALLNTNSRFLHDAMVKLAQHLTNTLPGDLQCCFFTNSGSEANDLALQISELTTGNSEVIAVTGGYHGHLKSLRAISGHPHLSNIKGQKNPDYVHMVSLPDVYQGKYQDLSTAGQLYAHEVEEVIDDCKLQSKQVSTFICEPIICCGGVIVPPQGYFQKVYDSVRKAGGLCVADETQTGLGRVGKHFWGFELHGVIPDIVTVGKAMGNGHPVGAVITTKNIAEKFASTGIEYFNTFGGNPVSMAIASSVLDVIEEETLQIRANTIGTHLIEKLEILKAQHDEIGDIRGEGLMVGIELVVSKKTKEPNPALAQSVKKR